VTRLPLLACLWLTGCLVVSPAAQPATGPGTEAPLPPAPEAEQPVLDAGEIAGRVLRGINRERTLRRLPALAVDSALGVISRAHSADMAARGYFSHDSPEGLRAAARARRADYRYRALGENLFQGSRYGSVARIPLRNGGYRYDYDYHSPTELAELVVQGWMDSPGHRENMLSPEFSNAGLGLATDDRDRVFVTLMLSRPVGP
jgi:uncharacterized protein YkwD